MGDTSPKNFTKRGYFIMSERKNKEKIVYKETIGLDANGEVIFDVIKKNCWENGNGFVISYSAPICELVEMNPTISAFRLFTYIAHNQQYGEDGLHFGFSCTKTHLREKLKLDRKSVYSALKWLKENHLVLETKVNGNREFMVNPYYVTVGSRKKKRIKEWNEGVTPQNALLDTPTGVFVRSSIKSADNDPNG